MREADTLPTEPTRHGLRFWNRVLTTKRVLKYVDHAGYFVIEIFQTKMTSEQFFYSLEVYALTAIFYMIKRVSIYSNY